MKRTKEFSEPHNGDQWLCTLVKPEINHRTFENSRKENLMNRANKRALPYSIILYISTEKRENAWTMDHGARISKQFMRYDKAIKCWQHDRKKHYTRTAFTGWSENSFENTD